MISTGTGNEILIKLTSLKTEDKNYEARITLENGDIAQAKNYTEAYNFKRGLLINFGSPSLQYKLIFNNKHQL